MNNCLLENCFRVAEHIPEAYFLNLLNSFFKERVATLGKCLDETFATGSLISTNQYFASTFEVIDVGRMHPTRCLRIGSCLARVYRVMVHAGSFKSTKEV